MSALSGMVLGILAVVVAFGFIIFIHEMGHFLTARAVDIRCPQFAIGFGPQLFGFRWRGTNFAVRLFPLGGYVLMNGEEPTAREEDPWSLAVSQYLGEESFPARPEQLLARMDAIPTAERGTTWQEVYDQVKFARAKEFPNLASVEGNFHDRSIAARILVISGGVIMNFLATIAILWFLAPIVGLGAFFRDWSPVITQVVSGMPADQAGVQTRDRVVAINGKDVQTAAEAMQALSALPCQPTKIAFDRQGQRVESTITPVLALGADKFNLDDRGNLVLSESDAHKEVVGKVVVSPDLNALLAVAKAPGVKEVTVEFEGVSAPTVLKMPEGFSGPRGQIGIQFGVADIRFEDKLSTKVSSVAPGSPAAKAGVEVGDLLCVIGPFDIVSGGEQPFGSMAEAAIQANSRLDQSEPLVLIVNRSGKYEVLKVERPNGIASMAQLGVSLASLTTADKAMAPFDMIWTLIKSPYETLYMWLHRDATGSEIVENMQGPIGIMQLIYQLHDNGILQFLFFMALLNAAIGAFNLLPFPALDGARLVFLFIAGVRGRGVDPEKEARVHLLGLMVLLTFVVFVTFGDIKKLLASHVFVM